MKKKTPEHGVTQINDQKKLRMKEKKKKAHSCFVKHTQVWFISRNTEIGWAPPSHPGFSFNKVICFNSGPLGC